MTASIQRPTLRGEDVICVPFGVEHAEAQYEAVVESEESLSQWMPWYSPTFGPEDARAWAEWCTKSWEEGNHFEFAGLDHAGTYLGACGLGNVDPNGLSANLQYWTRTSAVGLGVASSAAGLVAKWGIHELGIGRVEVMMATSNVASRRVAERSGARFEGILRNRIRWEGRNYDAALFSFTPADFEPS